MSLEGWNPFQWKTTDGQMSNGPCCVICQQGGLTNGPRSLSLSLFCSDCKCRLKSFIQSNTDMLNKTQLDKSHKGAINRTVKPPQALI